MNCEQMNELLPDYLQGALDRATSDRVEQHLHACDACSEAVALWHKLGTLPKEQSSPQMRERFEAMLSAYQSAREEVTPRLMMRERRQEKVAPIWSAPAWMRWAAVAACAVMLLGGGFVAGRVTTTGNSPHVAQQGATDVEVLRRDLDNMRQLLVLSMLQLPSGPDRMQAISYSTQQGNSDPKVLEALLQTLRYDPNVDVRLAALDALGRYGQQPMVRQELVEALNKQQSPLVQVALIDQLVELRAANARRQLEQFKQDTTLNPVVRRRAEWALSRLN